MLCSRVTHIFLFIALALLASTLAQLCDDGATGCTPGVDQCCCVPITPFGYDCACCSVALVCSGTMCVAPSTTSTASESPTPSTSQSSTPSPSRTPSSTASASIVATALPTPTQSTTPSNTAPTTTTTTPSNSLSPSCLPRPTEPPDGFEAALIQCDSSLLLTPFTTATVPLTIEVTVDVVVVITGNLVLLPGSQINSTLGSNDTPIRVTGDISIDSGTVVYITTTMAGGGAIHNGTFVTLLVSLNGTVTYDDTTTVVLSDARQFVDENGCTQTMRGTPQTSDQGRAFGVLFTVESKSGGDDDAQCGGTPRHSGAAKKRDTVIIFTTVGCVALACLVSVIGIIIGTMLYRRGACFSHADEKDAADQIWQNRDGSPRSEETLRRARSNIIV